MNDWKKQIYSRCYFENGFNLGEFIEKFLLFDTYILASSRLKEVASLIEIFGYDGFKLLCNSGSLKICINSSFIGCEYQNNYNLNNYLLGQYSHQINELTEGVPVNLYFKELKNQGIRISEIKSSVRKNLLSKIKKDSNYLNQAVLETDNYIQSNKMILKRSLNLWMQQNKYPENTNVELSIENNKSVNGVVYYTIHSNFSKVFNCDFSVQQKAISASIAALTLIHQLLLEMNHFQSIVCLPDTIQDLILLENTITSRIAKQQIFTEYSNFSNKINSLQKIHRFLEFPDFSSIKSLKAEDLINLKNSKECKEFKNWLITAEEKDLTEKSIKESFGSFQSRISNLYSALPFKIIRFIVPSAIPIPIISLGISAIDSLIENFFIKNTGVSNFLNNKYPSFLKSQK